MCYKVESNDVLQCDVEIKTFEVKPKTSIGIGTKEQNDRFLIFIE